jgi:membrane associated rhomboid family serine protease
MTSNVPTDLVLLIYLAVIGSLIGMPLIVAFRQVRLERRRIMADGTQAPGQITAIKARTNGQAIVNFTFDPTGASKPVTGRQVTSMAAVRQRGLMPGSSVTVHYLPKWARWGFIPALTYVERILEVRPKLFADESGQIEPPLFYILFLNQRQRKFRWIGGGDVTVAGQTIRFTAYRRRSFWFPKLEQTDFLRSAIVDVERHDASVGLTVLEADGAKRPLQFRTVSASDAESLATLLPDTKTADFTPVITESANFAAALTTLTPKPYATPALIGINVLMFIIATVLGGGLIKVHPDVMIGLGTDYTPLTLGGQWWRLLTSVFLHFGLLHVAFNMLALYVNGLMAERIFGSVRYLVIYLVAGLAGSIASLLWHPVVNGAGASGAIFGILGALLAFFVKREGGVPASVIKAQRNSAMIFIAYNLLNGARQGIDNAAHIGGLSAGFVMGFLLSRPLSPDRNQRSWARQWTVTLGVAASLAALIGFEISAGDLAPRQARDSQGRLIPREALMPAPRSFGGVRLGMTPEEVLAKKGNPISKSNPEWIFNTIDARHDGVLTVGFGSIRGGGERRVVGLEFEGHDIGSAPPEIPYMNSLTVADVISKYGEPIRRQPQAEGFEWLWFPNGTFFHTRFGKVFGYGVYDVALLGG